MGIRHKFWTPEEDAKLLALMQDLRGKSRLEIARATTEIMGRPVTGIAGRISSVPELNASIVTPPKPEPKRRARVIQSLEEEPEERTASDTISLARVPVALAPRSRDETRPYDRRTTLYAKSTARAESRVEMFKRILREEMRA